MPRKTLILFLLPLLLFAAACSDDRSDAATPTAAPPAALDITFKVDGTDGVSVSFATPPRRIVSLAPHATEIICAIGGGDDLVAVDKFANCPKGSSDKPAVDSYQPSVEAIAAYKPDLVYLVFDPGDVAAALRRLDIPVLLLDVPSSLDGVFGQIQLWGRIIGHESEAQALVTSMQKQRDEVLAKVKDVTEGPRYFHELDATLYTVRDDTFEGSLYSLLKAKDIAAGTDSQYPQLSAEAVVAKDPQVIVLVDGETAAGVAQRPGWQNVTAVKDHHICELDPDLLSRPGPYIVDGLEALAECLYPN